MPDKNDELRYHAAASLTNKRFELILLPTEQCNFRCLYCYEDFQIQKMSLEIIGSVKLFLNKRIPTLKIFDLQWFGGEPLLEKRIVIEITKHAKLLCERYGVAFYSTMTTNGYLLDVNTFVELTQLGVRSYQITFDGDKENHNQFRLLANSTNGSFDKIWNNLLEMKKQTELDFSVTIRCHLTSINKVSIQSLLKRIQDAFSADKRFIVLLKEIWALGAEGDCKIQHLNKEMRQVVIEELQNEYRELSFFDNTGKDYICYAAKPNCFLIRADGTIGKCTVALNSEANNVGRLLNDGTIDMDKTKFLLWSQGFDNLDKERLGCPYYNTSLSSSKKTIE